MKVHVGPRPPFKKSLFPVQWVPKIVASRAVAKLFFFSLLCFGKKTVKIKLKNIKLKK